jgi:hypothetical protein
MVDAVIASCVAIGRPAATYCGEQDLNPLGAASGLVASTDQPETPPNEIADQESQAPPAEPTTEETPPPAETAAEAPEPEPEPEKAAPPSSS